MQKPRWCMFLFCFVFLLSFWNKKKQLFLKPWSPLIVVCGLTARFLFQDTYNIIPSKNKHPRLTRSKWLYFSRWSLSYWCFLQFTSRKKNGLHRNNAHQKVQDRFWNANFHYRSENPSQNCCLWSILIFPMIKLAIARAKLTWGENICKEMPKPLGSFTWPPRANHGITSRSDYDL